MATGWQNCVKNLMGKYYTTEAKLESGLIHKTQKNVLENHTVFGWKKTKNKIKTGWYSSENSNTIKHQRICYEYIFKCLFCFFYIALYLVCSDICNYVFGINVYFVWLFYQLIIYERLTIMALSKWHINLVCILPYLLKYSN